MLHTAGRNVASARCTWGAEADVVIGLAHKGRFSDFSSVTGAEHTKYAPLAQTLIVFGPVLEYVALFGPLAGLA